MSAPVHIRAAEPADVEVLVDFNCDLARESEHQILDPEVVRQGVAGLLANPAAGYYTVAEQAGRVVGCVLITFDWSDWRNGWMWWIQSVYVHADARRQGVFRMLFESIRERAVQEEGVRGLRLYVERENATAMRTYASLGMEETPYRVYELLVD